MKATKAGSELMRRLGVIQRTRFENGLTVRELKEIIKDWPEEDENGDPCEVWLGDGSDLSNEAREVSPLNFRRNNDRQWADLILSHDA